MESSRWDAGHWDARYAASDLVWGAEANRWVVGELGGLPPGRALDLACGEGRNALWLAALGWRVTAVDFSAVALERGRRLAAAQSEHVAARLEWVNADLREYVPPPGRFELVLVAYLQVPAAERRAVLRRAASALSQGGTLLVIGHDTSNLTDGVGGPQDPAVLFTPQDVVADLAGRGLRVERAERVRRPTPGPDGATLHAVDALARLHRPRPA
ncbi:MAG TPA: class I SAM-dependent methyltransferase [Actinomycetes bacterium]|jgi:SAM-dependent methyltransferase|nr:class I SAM-dependent methyltransferase [Actinomycetes bacterium]